MPHPISARLRAALYAQQTGEVILAVCSIDHPSIVGGPLRVVNDLQNIVSDGNTYVAFPFQITLPADTEEGLPRVRLVLDNVDRTIVQAIRNIPPSTTPTVQINLVLKSQPNVIEVSFPSLSLRTVDYDVFVVEGDLALNDDDLEPFPALSFTPASFPGLF